MHACRQWYRGDKINIASAKLGLLAAALATATAARAEAPAVRSPAPAGGSESKPAVSTAQQLRQLLLDRPPVPITPPQEAPRVRRRPPAPRGPIISRRCRIVYRPDTGWYLLTFLSERKGQAVQPLWVLPSQLLERIEPLVAARPAAVFKVSGEAIDYRGRSFILLRSVRLLDAPERPRGRAGAAADTPRPAESPHKAQASPATQSADSQDEILRRMKNDRPGRPVLLPTERGKVARAESVAPAAGREQLNEDRGEMRIDRLVTIFPDEAGEWWQGRFESDNTLQDQPMRLLPCRKLQEAERLVAARKRKTLRLRITGQITQYKGRQYLLLRKLLPERDMGQF